MNVLYIYITYIYIIYLRIDTSKYFDKHNNADYWEFHTNLKPLLMLL